jgi:hypothetical protein
MLIQHKKIGDCEMLRKFLCLIALFVLGVLALAACAGQAGPAGPAGASLTEDQTKALETAGKLAGISFPATEGVPRGCPACHLVVDAETGKYTLPYEAHERAEARGEEHPSAAPDGTAIGPKDDVNVTVCLQCHASGEGDREGKGVIAPLSLRDIVHPAHMASQYFKLHYGGNCFTCHNVNSAGGWDLLTLKVEVNDKGVPADDENLPIPGAVTIGP